MITGAQQPPRSGRVVRVAIAASLLVHLLFALAVVGAYDAMSRLIARAPLHQRLREPDETVTLSTALHIERRTRAAEAHRTRAAAPPPRAALAPRPVPLAKPAAAPAPAARKELAKVAPRATPRPLPTSVPTMLPTPDRESAERKRIALAPRPLAPAPLQRPGTSARYSAAQLAAIQSELAKAIANDRAVESPLSNVKHQVHAATPHRSAINFLGVQGRLNGFEGLCEPLRSWTTGGLVHFYVTCRTTHDDGTVRQEAIPWPLTYAARRIAYDADGPVLPPGEVPPPDPSWHPDATQRIDPDVILYLRKKGYRI